jgi:hypothetical protein
MQRRTVRKIARATLQLFIVYLYPVERDRRLVLLFGGPLTNPAGYGPARDRREPHRKIRAVDRRTQVALNGKDEPISRT